MSLISEFAAKLDAAVREAEAAGAEKIAESARARVKVDTGRLRDAIHTDEQPDGVYVIAGDKEAWYGHMVEHGTTHSPAEPFLVPALEENRAAVISDIDKAIREIR